MPGLDVNAKPFYPNSRNPKRHTRQERRAWQARQPERAKVPTEQNKQAQKEWQAWKEGQIELAKNTPLDTARNTTKDSRTHVWMLVGEHVALVPIDLYCVGTDKDGKPLVSSVMKPIERSPGSPIATWKSLLDGKNYGEDTPKN